ncbi:hypothetical protein AB8A21_34405 [Streptomyces sp. BF23-18]|uniref:hypothetical protein n=1 Tax=Streptomyces sp. BF23-18 TaxID=3240282 RepID=UPI0034E5784E
MRLGHFRGLALRDVLEVDGEGGAAVGEVGLPDLCGLSDLGGRGEGEAEALGDATDGAAAAAEDLGDLVAALAFGVQLADALRR